ncbi:MAG: hypothetical protein LOD91_01730 [Limnochordales bacterium]|nr:hypothetical protein [Limnochordales bacterium]
MGALQLERVALQVDDLAVYVRLFSELLDTTFRHHEITSPTEGRVRLAFSPLGIELLQSDQPPGGPGLRSFHVRVRDLQAMRAKVTAAGGHVLSQFQVGQMAHLATRIGPFRILFVEYPGARGMDALFPVTAPEDASAADSPERR